MHHLPRSFFLLFMTPMVLISGGCDGGGGDSSKDDALSPTATIGAEGGSIAAEGGAQVDVPAGALAEGVELSIEQGTSPEEFGAIALPESFDAVSTVLVTPHGTTFATPATLSIPYAEAELGDAVEELVLMRLDDPSDTDWSPEVGLELESGTASAEIDGFSVYSLAAVASGACPCWSGADLRAWRRTATNNGLKPFFGVSTGSYTSSTCSLNAGNSTKAYWSVNQYRNGQATCNRQDWVGSYGGSASALLTGGRAQADACLSLVAAVCRRDTSLGQVSAYATGLPSGESVVVTVTGTSGSRSYSSDVTLAVAEELYWSPIVYTAGTAYSVSIKTQPSSTTCSIAAATGTVTEGNSAVEVSCVPVSTGGCTADFVPSTAGTPGLSATGTCVHIVDSGKVGTIVFSMGTMDPVRDGFDLESDENWAAYAAAGGDAMIILSMTDLPATGGSATLEDYSGINGIGFGSSTIKNRSVINLGPVNTTAKTFSLEVAVNVLDYTSVYPPPPGTDNNASFGDEVAAGTHKGTLTISGTYEQLP